MTIINESGLYSLVLSSKLSTAKKFKRWVTSEVIPSIRKHGAYMTPDKLEEVLLKPDTLIQLAQNLKTEQEKRRALEVKVEEQKPKVLFAESVEAAKTSILIGELAKLLKQNGINIGQNRLFEWLRNNGYLIKRQGSDYNMPTQRAMEMGLFEIKETTITHSDGHIHVSKTPKVTGKGQVYFVNLFVSKEEKPCQNSES
jgi:anti-repressor protein